MLMATATVTLNCACVEKPDLAAIDLLARIRLGLSRCGCELRLEAPSDDLVALIELAGLGDVLRVEVQRKSEQREELRRIEEEGELGHPPVA